MNLIALEVGNKIVKYSVYVTLLFLAVYFIYAGDTIQKFSNKKTSFAEYGEPVSELPTILAFIEYADQNTTFEYGKDFNWTFQSDISWRKGFKGTNLTRGVNHVESGLKLVVSDLLKEDRGFSDSYFHNFKISPDGIPTRNQRSIVLKCSFESTSGYEGINFKIGMVLTSENNTYCNTGVDYKDGHASRQFVKIGETNFVIIMPEKFVYHPEIEKCRDRPFNQLLAEKMSKHMFHNCTYPCLSEGWYCKFGIPLDNLPVCRNKAELECFIQSKRASKKEIGREDLIKPCTLLQYKSVGATWYNPKQHEAMFRMTFHKPPRVTVKEEYLIYDLLTMIGAVGGTLGIFIGFSFHDLFKGIWSSCTSRVWKLFTQPKS